MMQSDIQTIAAWLGNGSINIFGPPFSGKDTQAKKLAETFDGVVVAGGDILRHDHGNSEVQRIMAEGGVIPSDMFLSIIPPFFERPDLSGKPLFLSSVGRLMEEVPTIVKATTDSGHPIRAVILLKLPEDKIWEHFEISKQLQDRGSRADDTSEALKIRIAEFNKTQPVIDYYSSENLLIEIDDSKNPDEVGELIIEALLVRASA